MVARLEEQDQKKYADNKTQHHHKFKKIYMSLYFYHFFEVLPKLRAPAMCLQEWDHTLKIDLLKQALKGVFGAVLSNF